MRRRESKKEDENLIENNATLEGNMKLKEKTVKEKFLSVVWNIAFRQKIQDRQIAYKKWRMLVKVQKRKEKNTKKVISECILSEARLAVHKWIQIIRGKKIVESLKNFEEQKIRLKIGKKKSQLDISQRITSKEDAEKVLDKAKKEESKTREIDTRLLGYLIRKRDLNTYLPLHQAVLRRWKAIADKEKHLSDTLMALAKKHVYETLFIKMKNATLEKKEKEGKLRAFKKMTELSRKSLLKNAFDKWQNFSYYISNQAHFEECQYKRQGYAGVENCINVLNQRLYGKGENIIKKKLGEKIIHNWEKASITQRFIKDKAEAFLRNRKYIGLKFAIQKWRSRTFATEKIKIKYEKAASFNSKKITRKIFTLFREATHSGRALPKILNEISNSFGFNNIKCSLSLLKRYANSHADHCDNLKQNSAFSLSAVTKRIFQARIVTYLGIINSNSTLIRGRSNKLARAITSIYQWKLRGCFEKLLSQKNKKKLEGIVEIDGKQAHELERINVEISQIQDKFRNEGYDEQELEEKVGKVKENKEGLIKKALGRWLAFQNENDNVIIAIDQWKKYTRKQLDLKKKLLKLINFTELHPLHKGFTRWRNYRKKIIEEFKGATKDELIETCIENGRDKAALTYDVELKEKKLSEEEEIANDYARKKQVSKRFCLLFADVICRKALRKGFKGWKSNIKRARIAQLRKNLDELEVQTKETIEINNDLEDRNMSLSTENEELKQLSFESVSLAAVRL